MKKNPISSSQKGRSIVCLPTFDHELAARFVTARERIDGFPSLEDLGTVLELPGQDASGFYESVAAGSPDIEADDGEVTQLNGGADMPPRGVKQSSKRDRQYKHVRDSQRERGVPESRAEEIAARTVNKERARSGESRSRSRSSTSDISSSRRGGLRSGKPGPSGRTREQLYQEARRLGVEGRSSMNKAQLQRAVDNRKR